MIVVPHMLGQSRL